MIALIQLRRAAIQLPLLLIAHAHPTPVISGTRAALQLTLREAQRLDTVAVQLQSTMGKERL
jgi:hypothetical protein